MKALRAAILGAGFTGTKHAKNLKSLPDVEVVAVCDSDASRADRLAAELPGEVAVYSDHHAMLDDARPDMLFVCLPPFAHSDEVEEAARRGVAVFIEKPVALTSGKAYEMEAAVAAAGVVSQVGFMLRSSGPVRKLKSLLESGTAGRPTLFIGTYQCNALHSPWWRDRAKSGGQLFEQAIHVYDLAAYLLGEPVRASGAMANLMHTEVEGYTAEDTSASVVTFASGAIATISASNSSVPNRWYHEETLICERLVARIVGTERLELTWTGNPLRNEVLEFTDDPFLAEVTSFVAAVRDKRPTVCPFADGAVAVRLVEAVVESAERRLEVSMKATPAGAP